VLLLSLQIFCAEKHRFSSHHGVGEAGLLALVHQRLVEVEEQRPELLAKDLAFFRLYFTV
jgi:hypothetical protein